MKKFEVAQSVGLVPRDMSREITLRNACEDKRLEGQLERYNTQLHNSMVSLQAEIKAIKATSYSNSKAARLREVQQQALLNNERRKQELQTQRTSGSLSPALLNNERGKQELQKQRASGSLSPALARRSKPKIELSYSTQELVLPDINPGSASLMSQGASKSPHSLVPQPGGLLNPPTPPSGRRPRSQTREFLNPPSVYSRPRSQSGGLLNPPGTAPSAYSRPRSQSGRLLNTPISPSVYKPRSLPDLARKEGEGGRDSPRRQLKSPDKAAVAKSLDEANFRRQKAVHDIKLRVDAFINSSQPSSLELIDVSPPVSPSIEIDEAPDVDTPEEPDNVGQMSDKELALFHNSLLLKATSASGLSASMPDLAERGFMDFNEVIDKRLRQSQEELPSEEEMRKVRYLRWRKNPAQPDILTVFDKDPEEDSVDTKVESSSPRLQRSRARSTQT